MTPTVKEILKQINNYYGDTSRPAEETRDGLWAIKEEIDMKLSTLAEEARED